MSSASGKSIGMMDPAYFVGRRELLEWVNTLLDVNLTKIEQTASGAYSCQIVDACFPGKIRLKKIRWDAKQDYEFVDNYKELQQAFDRLQINKHIEVNKLIRAKYQDNLEFMQWMKSFHGQNASSTIEEYAVTAHDRRSRGKGGARVPRRVAGGAEASSSSGASASASASTRRAKAKPLRENSSSNKASRATKASAPQKLAAVAALREDVAHWKSTAEALETERNFYFGKMREIEILLQQYSDADQNPTAGVDPAAVFAGLYSILYAADDDAATLEVGVDAASPVAEPPLAPSM